MLFIILLSTLFAALLILKGWLLCQASSALKMFGRRPPNWEMPYCQMAIWLSQQGYVVFTSSHKEVRETLKGCNEYCIAIVPTLELKNEWIEKLHDRYKDSGLLKDQLAWQNAKDRYEANITEIINDVPDTFLIDSMDYDLKQIVGKCEKIEDLVRDGDTE